MTPVTLRDRNVALAKKLATVTTVGEAWDFGMEASRDLLAAAEEMNRSTGPAELDAQKMLRAAADDVTRYLAPMRGDDGAPVPAATWKDLRGAIGRAFALMWAIEEVLPPQVRHTAWQTWAEILGDVGAAVPGAAKSTIDFAGDLAANTAGAAADAASNVLGRFIKGAWPILLAAAVVLGAGVYLAVSGVAVPKVKVST